MASTVVYACECGHRFSYYIPKRVFFRLADVDSRSDAELAEVDAQEEKDGEIEFARFVAEKMGLTFIDSRLQLLSSCPSCGAPLADVVDMLRGALRGRGEEANG